MQRCIAITRYPSPTGTMCAVDDGAARGGSVRPVLRASASA
jgi:hypothetical protein